MNWSEAIKQAARGVKVRRVDWFDESMYIVFEIRNMNSPSVSCMLVTEEGHDYSVCSQDLASSWEIFTEKLRNCPWCNTKVEIGTLAYSETLYRARCTKRNCCARGPMRRTSAEAITEWNRCL